MNWLLANKAWIFSGVGVAVLGFFVRKFFQHATGDSAAISASRSSVVASPVASGSNISQTVNFTTVHSAPTPTPPVRSDYSEKPTPADIFIHLNSLPAFQQNKVKDSYVGLKVCWLVRFATLAELEEWRRKLYKTDPTHLILVRYSTFIVATTVDIERFPRLKIIHDGTPLRISGTVSEVRVDGRINLDDVDIKFEE